MNQTVRANQQEFDESRLNRVSVNALKDICTYPARDR